MRRAILVLVVSLVLAGGGGDEKPENAGAFVTTLIRDLGSGKTAKAWGRSIRSTESRLRWRATSRVRARTGSAAR